jgi:hypothetical protein
VVAHVGGVQQAGGVSRLDCALGYRPGR